MSIFSIRTINSAFVSSCDMRYAHRDQARSAAIGAAAAIAIADFRDGERAVTAIGEVLENSGKVIARVAVSMSVADLLPA